jgi:hypothetical protein
MNNKLKDTWMESRPYGTDTGRKNTEHSAPKPFHQNPELNFTLKNIDPKILQRYSFDDNGGGYKGL